VQCVVQIDDAINQNYFSATETLVNYWTSELGRKMTMLRNNMLLVLCILWP
jgi:hypothetical protein